MAESKKEKHRCPPEPWPWPNVLKTPYYEGESVQKAQQKWLAHVRRVQRLTPMPRTTRK